MNFLQLCQRLIIEAGISGAITTAENQTGEAQRVTTWVAQAYTDILNDQAINWNFTRKDFSFQLSVGDGIYTFADLSLPTGVQWDVNSMRVATASNFADETFLIGQRFPEFRDQWLFSTRALIQSRPLNASVDNDTNLRIAPLPDQAYWLRGQYQLNPATLLLDTDEPLLPARFHMAIVWSALRSYGLFEAAPEVVARADMMYKEMMLHLAVDQSYEVICGGPIC